MVPRFSHKHFLPQKGSALVRSQEWAFSRGIFAASSVTSKKTKKIPSISACGTQRATAKRHNFTSKRPFTMPPFLRESETTIKINLRFSGGGGGQGGREENCPKRFFHGKRHDNKISKVKFLLSRNFVVMAQAPTFSWFLSRGGVRLEYGKNVFE